MSNDIGLHNYAAFIRMLIAVFFTLYIQIAFCSYAINFMATELSDIDAIEAGLITLLDLHNLNVVTFVISGILLLMTVYFLTYHIWLMCNNTTTYKHIRS